LTCEGIPREPCSDWLYRTANPYSYTSEGANENESLLDEEAGGKETDSSNNVSSH
jgi:hypothetical protein